MPEFVIENGVIQDYTGPGGDIVIPDGVTRLRENLYWGEKALKSVILPNSVTEIDAFAFQDCRNLIRVVLPAGLKSISKGLF